MNHSPTDYQRNNLFGHKLLTSELLQKQKDTFSFYLNYF